MKEKTEKKKIRVGSVIFRAFLIIVAGLTVGLAVFSFNARRIGGNELPMPFGYGASVVLSGSMEPTLLVNDLVFVEAQDDYDVGDVVVYQNGNTLIIHRIVQKDGETFVTRGDANNADDDPISLSDIKGAMIFRIPFIGLLFKWLKTLPGTLIVLGLAVFLLYRSRRKEREKDSEQIDEIVEEIRRLQALQQQPSQPVSDDSPESPATTEQPTVGLGLAPAEDSASANSSDNDAEQGAHAAPQEQPAEDSASAHSVNDTAEQGARTAPQEQPAGENASVFDDFSDIDTLINEIENSN